VLHGIDSADHWMQPVRLLLRYDYESHDMVVRLSLGMQWNDMLKGINV
jgi:hypothetical protein